MATDMRYPPGVTRGRKGERAAMASTAWRSAAAWEEAKPRRRTAPSSKISRAWVVGALQRSSWLSGIPTSIVVWGQLGRRRDECRRGRRDRLGHAFTCRFYLPSTE